MGRRLNILRVVLLLAICLPAFSLSAQTIKVSAPDEVMQGESFYIQYMLFSQQRIGEDPVLLEYKDFEVLESPQVSISYSSNHNGREMSGEFVTSTTLNVRSDKMGAVKLPVIQFVVDGKKIKSQKTTIKINTLPQREDVRAFVKVSATRSRINVSDTLSVSYKLYTSKQISKLISVEIPQSREFYAQNITPRMQTLKEETIDGIVYQVMDLRKVILQPRSQGSKTLSAGQVIVEYAHPTGRQGRDYSGALYDEVVREKLTLPVDAVTILVQNLIDI